MRRTSTPTRAGRPGSRREAHAFAFGKQVDAWHLVQRLAAAEINPRDAGRALFQLVQFRTEAFEIVTRRLNHEEPGR